MMGKDAGMTVHLEETLTAAGRYDVLVAGGGLSGVAAALSAGRCGKRVLLIEKQCSLGGLATTGLVNFWVPLCNGRGKMIIRGMAEEFLNLPFGWALTRCRRTGSRVNRHSLRTSAASAGFPPVCLRWSCCGFCAKTAWRFSTMR